MHQPRAVANEIGMCLVNSEVIHLCRAVGDDHRVHCAKITIRRDDSIANLQVAREYPFTVIGVEGVVIITSPSMVRVRILSSSCDHTAVTGYSPISPVSSLYAKTMSPTSMSPMGISPSGLATDVSGAKLQYLKWDELLLGVFVLLALLSVSYPI